MLLGAVKFSPGREGRCNGSDRGSPKGKRRGRRRKTWKEVERERATASTITFGLKWNVSSQEELDVRFNGSGVSKKKWQWPNAKLAPQFV